MEPAPFITTATHQDTIQQTYYFDEYGRGYLDNIEEFTEKLSGGRQYPIAITYYVYDSNTKKGKKMIEKNNHLSFNTETVGIRKDGTQRILTKDRKWLDLEKGADYIKE